MKKCKWCGNEHNKIGITCSRTCATSLGNFKSKGNKKWSNDAKKKLSKIKTLEKKEIIKFCLKCKKEFKVIRKISKDGFEIIGKKEKKFCSKKCSNSHIQTDEQNKLRSKKLTGYIYKNRGNKEKKVYFCSNCNKEIRKNKTGLCIVCYYKSDLPSVLTKGKAGGYRKGSSRGKSGRYKGIWCDSSWELAYVIYNLEHNIKFKRNTQGFEYTFNNKKHKYFPDFQLENGEYVEIKNFIDEKTKAKINQFNYKLKIIDRREIKKYIDYAKNKYGENYISLYKLM